MNKFLILIKSKGLGRFLILLLDTLTSKKANFLLDKGTDRIKFLENYNKQFISEKNKTKSKKNYYSWVDCGSEYRASELSSALIYSQFLRSNKLKKKEKSFGINIIIF